MKIKIFVIAPKVVEAPEFMRPYITGEKKWDEMDFEEELNYLDWYEDLEKNENLADEDEGDWEIVE